MVEQLTLNQRVVGSSPTSPTNQTNGLEEGTSEARLRCLPHVFHREPIQSEMDLDGIRVRIALIVDACSAVTVPFPDPITREEAETALALPDHDIEETEAPIVFALRWAARIGADTGRGSDERR